MQMSEAQQTAPASSTYAYKASLIGSAHRFVLTREGLSWQIAGRSGLWPYGEISAIRLSFRPVWMQQHRFRADLIHVGGGRIAILSTSWQTAALMAAQNDAFRDFILELHRGIEKAGGTAVLSAGLGRRAYAAALALVAILAAAMAALLIRAVATGELAGALFILGFAALFARQLGGYLRRNRPRSYRFDSLPASVLP